MSSDLELLELAAKAAGAKKWMVLENPVWYSGDSAFEADFGDGYKSWNPLEDDGDALRLAMKLRLSVKHNHPADQERWVVAHRNRCEGCYALLIWVDEDFEDESQRGSATRRTIVRAAAEIGRAMRKGGAA